MDTLVLHTSISYFNFPLVQVLLSLTHQYVPFQSVFSNYITQLPFLLYIVHMFNYATIHHFCCFLLFLPFHLNPINICCQKKDHPNFSFSFLFLVAFPMNFILAANWLKCYCGIVDIKSMWIQLTWYHIITNNPFQSFLILRFLEI